MDRRKSEVQAALVQVQQFLTEHDALLHDVNTTGARSTLDDVVTNIAARVTEQDAHRRGSKGARARLLASRESLLVHHMRAVASAARLLGDEAPELAGLSAPPANCGTKALLGLADGMLEVATQHQDTLTPLLGPAFLNRLRGTITDVRAAMVGGRVNRSKRAAATEALVVESSRGRNAVRVLDALVLYALAEDAALTREWKSCRKILVIGAPTTDGKPEAVAEPESVAPATKIVAAA